MAAEVAEVGIEGAETAAPEIETGAAAAEHASKGLVRKIFHPTEHLENAAADTARTQAEAAAESPSHHLQGIMEGAALGSALSGPSGPPASDNSTTVIVNNPPAPPAASGPKTGGGGGLKAGWGLALLVVTAMALIVLTVLAAREPDSGSIQSGASRWFWIGVFGGAVFAVAACFYVAASRRGCGCCGNCRC